MPSLSGHDREVGREKEEGREARPAGRRHEKEKRRRVVTSLLGEVYEDKTVEIEHESFCGGSDRKLQK